MFSPFEQFFVLIKKPINEKEEFLLSVKKLIREDGRVIFNRLYYGEKRSEAVRFGNKLEKIFKKIEVVYPEANVMFVCSE